MHAILAASVAPELLIDKPEADLLAATLVELNRFYGKAVDPKLIAWMGVIGACGKVYGPRVAAIGFRRKREKEEQAAANPPKPQGFRPTVVTPAPQPTAAPAPTPGPADFSTLASVPNDFGDS